MTTNNTAITTTMVTVIYKGNDVLQRIRDIKVTPSSAAMKYFLLINKLIEEHDCDISCCIKLNTIIKKEKKKSTYYMFSLEVSRVVRGVFKRLVYIEFLFGTKLKNRGLFFDALKENVIDIIKKKYINSTAKQEPPYDDDRLEREKKTWKAILGWAFGHHNKIDCLE